MSNNASDNKDFVKITDFFWRLHGTYANSNDYEFILIDEKISKKLWILTIKVASIYKYVNGSLDCNDLYTKEGQDSEMCLIQIGDPVNHPTPRKSAYVILPCPHAISASRRSSSDSELWRCSTCKEIVEYACHLGTNAGSFHCKCGKSDPTKSLFRCHDKKHDIKFVKYPSIIKLRDNLSSLKLVFKEVNILILGETGVGKSTWINSFQNYMYFDNLREAIITQEFHVLIPSRFTFISEEERTIQVGDHDIYEAMESGQCGHAFTKEPRSYIFNVGGVRIRMIDTPGIGDSRGIEEDRKNINNILSHLSHYDEIHAVCILLKPNNSRLTTLFRYCIQEILVMLHSLLKDKILFCFTNARCTFYKPGNTLPVLKKELRDRNIGIQATPDNCFCFDNEPFRLLACLKSGVHFGDCEIDSYAKSWDKSVCEMKRLYGYINTQLKPHEVKETLRMNESRSFIEALNKPLADVARTINHNIKSYESVREQINLATKDIKRLERDLKYTGYYDIEYIQADYLRTVCTHASCVKYVSVGRELVKHIVYEQICHDRCIYRNGIPIELTNNPDLRRCECIQENSGNCSKCGHYYTLHMHLAYELNLIEREFLSPEVQNEIQKKGALKAQKELLKRNIDTEIAELKEGEKHIMRASARFGSFIKANALIPYNDAVGDYLDMCIKLEKIKPKEIRNASLLSTMQRMKQEYEAQREILDNALGAHAGENIHTPDQVVQLQQDLFQLKHFGSTLKSLFEGISITHATRNKTFVEKIAPLPPKYTDKRNPKGMRWLFD